MPGPLLSVCVAISVTTGGTGVPEPCSRPPVSVPVLGGEGQGFPAPPSPHFPLADAAASAQEVLEEASSRLQGTFRFHTTTIQVESYSEEMRDCRECQPPRD